MKKKLEADLISIAHRILKLKNKSELVQLHLETQKLYEKLSVLLFVEENFAGVKPTIGYSDIQEQLLTAFEKQDEVIEEKQAEPKVDTVVAAEAEVADETTVAQEEVSGAAETPVAETETEQIQVPEEEEIAAIPVEEQALETEETTAVAEPEVEKEEIPVETLVAPEPETEEEITFEPLFQPAREEEPAVEIYEEPFVAKQQIKQITLEDLLGNVQPEPIFVRAEQPERTETPTTSNNPANDEQTVSKAEVIPTVKTEVVIDSKPSSLNDMLSKTITIGLNDRIAFEKQLFAGSSEDLNRVLSQLSTFNTYQEAHDFIEDMVKPDYNNWEGKDDYSKRFMEIVEKRFS